MTIWLKFGKTQHSDLKRRFHYALQHGQSQEDIVPNSGVGLQRRGPA